MEGRLPSGAAESQSRQAAKVESLAELQQAPLYSGYTIGSKLPSPLRCLRRSSSLHSMQPTQPAQPTQPTQPVQALSQEGSPSHLRSPRLRSRPRPPLPLPRAARRLLLPKAKEDRSRTGPRLGKLPAFASASGTARTSTVRCSNSPARGFEFQAAAARPRRIGNFGRRRAELHRSSQGIAILGWCQNTHTRRTSCTFLFRSTKSSWRTKVGRCWDRKQYPDDATGHAAEAHGATSTIAASRPFAVSKPARGETQRQAEARLLRTTSDRPSA